MAVGLLSRVLKCYKVTELSLQLVGQLKLLRKSMKNRIIELGLQLVGQWRHLGKELKDQKVIDLGLPTVGLLRLLS